MKIVITEAFGNVGKAVIEKAYNRDHEIIVFEVDNRKTRKDARKYRNKIKNVIFGDVRDFSNVQQVVQECDAVIHLAAIIPPISKKHRELIMDVNYSGTKFN